MKLRVNFDTHGALVKLQREGGHASMDALLQSLLREAGDDEDAHGGSSDEESASEDEDPRPFSFRWFERDLKARKYFCGLGEDAFDWL